MKTKNVRRSASVLFRVLIASLLCLAAGMLTLLAFVPAAQQLHNNRHATWLTRLASTLGIEPSHGSGTPSTGADKANGGAVKIDKEPAEGTQPLMPAAVPFSGRPVDRAPVRAVRSGKLRDMRPIDPADKDEGRAMNIHYRANCSHRHAFRRAKALRSKSYVTIRLLGC